jgi:hypothetical protein
MTMSIMALPAPTMQPRSESAAADGPRQRFRNAWETSFGPPITDRPIFIDRRTLGGAAFLAQELGQSSPPETRPAADFAFALYARTQQSDDPVIAGDWVVVSRSL